MAEARARASGAQGARAIMQGLRECSAANPPLRRSFIVAQNERGEWVARERSGVIEGIFLSQREAIRFALFETGSRSAAAIVDDATAFQQH